MSSIHISHNCCPMQAPAFCDLLAPSSPPSTVSTPPHCAPGSAKSTHTTEIGVQQVSAISMTKMWRTYQHFGCILLPRVGIPHTCFIFHEASVHGFLEMNLNLSQPITSSAHDNNTHSRGWDLFVHLACTVDWRIKLQLTPHVGPWRVQRKRNVE